MYSGPYTITTPIKETIIMTAVINAYMRASTKEQDAKRAETALKDFAKAQGFRISAWYVENESGAILDRPELFRMLDNSEAGDVILLEQVDRLSRLRTSDWERLRRIIADKGVKIVALDLPTSWALVGQATDDFSGRMMELINSLLLDMLAAIARKDYEDRRRRQAEGVRKAKDAGRYPGKQANAEKHRQVIELRGAGWKIDDIVKTLNMGRSTVFKVLKANKE